MNLHLRQTCGGQIATRMTEFPILPRQANVLPCRRQIPLAFIPPVQNHAWTGRGNIGNSQLPGQQQPGNGIVGNGQCWNSGKWPMAQWQTNAHIGKRCFAGQANVHGFDIHPQAQTGLNFVQNITPNRGGCLKSVARQSRRQSPTAPPISTGLPTAPLQDDFFAQARAMCFDCWLTVRSFACSQRAVYYIIIRPPQCGMYNSLVQCRRNIPRCFRSKAQKPPVVAIRSAYKRSGTGNNFARISPIRHIRNTGIPLLCGVL